MLFSRVSILANRISGGSFWWRPLSFVLLAHHSIHWGFFIGSQLHSEVPNTRVSTVQIQTPPGEMDISTGGSINSIAIFTLSILFSTSTARILEKELKWQSPFFCTSCMVRADCRIYVFQECSFFDRSATWGFT